MTYQPNRISYDSMRLKIANILVDYNVDWEPYKEVMDELLDFAQTAFPNEEVDEI